MDCNKSFLGFPRWYDNLTVSGYPECNVQLEDLTDIWVIALNVANILLRLGIYIAIGFIIYGGVQFVISQGSPDKVAGAKATIQNAVIGLVVSISATLLVTYISGLF